MKKLTLTLVVGSLAATPVLADPSSYGKQARFGYAKVLNATPVYETVQVVTPHEQCYDEQVAYHRGGRSLYAPTVAGGIIGAAVGNALGHKKRNKQVGAIAGGLLGAAIGHDISRRHSQKQVTYRTETRCEVTEVVHEEERLSGYKVKYRYGGEVYRTFTPYDPGERIKVKVQVAPVY